MKYLPIRLSIITIIYFVILMLISPTIDHLFTTLEEDKKLKEIDRAGTFKSDDEVGYFFKSIQDIQDILNDFKLKEIK